MTFGCKPTVFNKEKSLIGARFTMAVSLMKVNANNGATAYNIGTHYSLNQGKVFTNILRDDHIKYGDYISFNTDIGDVLLWTGSLLHNSMANKSSKSRLILFAVFEIFPKYGPIKLSESDWPIPDMTEFSQNWRGISSMKEYLQWCSQNSENAKKTMSTSVEKPALHFHIKTKHSKEFTKIVAQKIIEQKMVQKTQRKCNDEFENEPANENGYFDNEQCEIIQLISLIEGEIDFLWESRQLAVSIHTVSTRRKTIQDQNEQIIFMDLLEKLKKLREESEKIYGTVYFEQYKKDNQHIKDFLDVWDNPCFRNLDMWTAFNE